MRKYPMVIGILVLLAGNACLSSDGPRGPVTSTHEMREPLFALKEMDMHLHAGMEREVGLKEWIDLAVADGRKVLVLLDHLELYRKTPQEYAAWAKEGGFPQWYTVGPQGHRALMADFAEAAKRDDVIIFRGWEIYEGELDTGLELEPMRMADVIGWHISPNHAGDPPDGKKLIRRIRQIAEAQKQVPVPMIVFHPFTMRFEHIQRKAQQVGKDLKTLTVANYRFFQPGEQEEVIKLLKGKSIYIEIARGTDACWQDPVLRETLIADIKPLADGGVQFTVSTDNHGLAGAKRPFAPERYCEALGVTPENTNGIVRELLARRERLGK